MSIACSSGSSSHSVPWGRRYLTLSSRLGPVTSCLEAAPLGHSPPPGVGVVGVALDRDAPLVLDEPLLPAADRAVGADRAGDPVGIGGPRPQRFRPGRLRRLAQPERVTFLELPDDRP